MVHEFGKPHWLTCSYLIYNPHRRREIWRFITYMFLHGSHQHIGFNCFMQLFVGELLMGLFEILYTCLVYARRASSPIIEMILVPKQKLYCNPQSYFYE